MGALPRLGRKPCRAVGWLLRPPSAGDCRARLRLVLSSVRHGVHVTGVAVGGMKSASVAERSLIRIQVLNGCVIGRAGQPLNVPLTSQRVAAFLALQTVPTRRSEVASRLWCGSGHASGQACLRSALWRLQDACGSAEVVDATRTHLRLSCAVSVDLRAQVAIATQLLHSPEIQEEDLDLELLEGELLPDWNDEWVLIERDRLRQLRLHALESFGRHMIELGRYGAAAEAGFAGLRADPLRESSHQLLIETYLAEGNRADALRQYEHYRRLLKRKLGLQPHARFLSLLREVRVRSAVD